MNAYTYKCPGCGSTLTFDPASQLLVCDNCGQLYSPAELKQKETVPASTSTPILSSSPSVQGQMFETQNMLSQDSYVQESSDAYMDVNLYHCSSCGAEIITNDVEISKFCSYCGQSTIIFDRVSKEKKPDKIIPFILTKEQALLNAKAKFREAKFLKDGIENVTVESVYGIYMPYWCYESDMAITAQVDVKVDKRMRHYTHEKHKVHNVLLDASKRFNNYVSKKLNPFPLNNAVDFDGAYLTGFYADRCDVSSLDREADARLYMRELLLEEAIEDSPGAPSRKIRELYGELYEKTGSFRAQSVKEDFKLISKKYMFCPIYFVTFRIADDTIIILVNGCNGKVVGSIPIDQVKLAKKQNKDMIICALIFGAIGAVLFGFMPILWSAALLTILGSSMYISGTKSKKKYEELYYKMNSTTMFDLSRNREE